MSGVKHTPVELHAVFNGHFWDVSVGPSKFSQSVGQCHRNSALGYGLDGAERYARLFAAAPDLLEALPNLTSVIAWLRNGCEVKHAITELEIYQHRINAAMTRATGDRPEKGGA